MPRIQFTFTNNNGFGVVLYTVPPLSTQLIWQGEINVHTSCTIDRDIPIGTEWRMKTSGTERFFDTYQTTSDPIQFHLISNCRTDLQFINNTASRVFLFSVDWLSQKEYQEGYVDPGTPSNFVRTMLPNSEWRIKDAPTGATISTYFTTPAPYQSFLITPSPPVITTGGTTIPVITTGGTIYSGPIPDNPTSTPTPIPDTPVRVASAKDSIFNPRGFNIDVANFEIWIGQRAGLTDKHQRRAAVYAALMVIAKNQNRLLYRSLPEEQVLMDWLAFQVKQTRIESARLALAEYDRWKLDPWSYQPPAGYDFPAYIILPPRSRVWLTTTPNPPVLANQSWQSFLAGIVATIYLTTERR